jgi:hypothetical protein
MTPAPRFCRVFRLALHQINPATALSLRQLALFRLRKPSSNLIWGRRNEQVGVPVRADVAHHSIVGDDANARLDFWQTAFEADEIR